MFPLYLLPFPKRDSNVPSILTLTQKEQRLSLIKQKIPFGVVSVYLQHNSFSSIRIAVKKYTQQSFEKELRE